MPEPPPIPADRRPPVFDTWREAEARAEAATLPVEAGDLTGPAGATPLVSPAVRRGHPAWQLALTSRAELRRAIVLTTVLGPCKANEA
jgi:hypothetical protein